MHLLVSEIFGPTLQGEGPSIGRRCGFLRLANCNLDCTWCDTRYSWDWDQFDVATETRRMSIAEVLATLHRIETDMLVITGGEPLLQQDPLGDVVAWCRDLGWRVEIETNGTVSWRQAPELVDQFNVSPKLSNSGVVLDRRIRPEVLRQFVASERAIFKFVAGTAEDLAEIADLERRLSLAPIYVMPLGATSEDVLGRGRALAEEVINRGWTLTTRLHILLWGDQRGR